MLRRFAFFPAAMLVMNFMDFAQGRCLATNCAMKNKANIILLCRYDSVCVPEVLAEADRRKGGRDDGAAAGRDNGHRSWLRC